MKQLLIVNSGKALNAGASNPKDLSELQAGAICLWELGAESFLAAAPTKDFAIALGRPNSTPFVIPEVDYASCTVVKSESPFANNWSASVSIPATEDGDTMTLVLVKKGAVPHERNTWTATETVFDATKQDNKTIAEKLGNYFKAFADSGSLPIEVTVENEEITIVALEGDWTLKCGDDLYGAEVTEEPRCRHIDKAYIQDLASQCAAGKGFTDTYQNGDSIYPGYPETVEDTPYDLYTLRFAVGRKSAKTRDEVVSQLVHIAVPTSGSAATALETIFENWKVEAKAKGEGD